MRRKKRAPNDRDTLISLLVLAICETERELQRLPTKKEVLDHLFSRSRDDPEAQELSERLDRMLEFLLHELEVEEYLLC